MSMIRSIATAITGLDAQSRAIGNISDNLSNSTTAGFKSIATRFEDTVSTDLKIGGNPGSSFGLGTISAPVYYNDKQGSIIGNQQGSSLAVSGNGMFAVTPNTALGASGSNLCYTRCGDFTLDSNGLLVNGAGFTLLGWSIDQTTHAVNAGSLIPIQITDMIDDGVATTNTNFDANLPAALAVNGRTSDAPVNIFDSKGYEHTVTYGWQKLDTNTWELTITAPGGAYNAATDTEADFTATATFVFDASGPQTIIDANGNSVVVNNTGKVLSITSSDVTVTDGVVTLPLSYKDQDPLVTTPTALATNINGAFEGLTQFADRNDSISIHSFSQDGTGTGTFNNFSFDESGYLSLNYSNGVTRSIYQIPLAMFNSTNTLERISGTAFRETLASGSPTMTAATTNGAGSFVVGALEMSTVDIASQFTLMVQAQAAYSANAKTITTSDAMLKTLINT